MNYLLSLSLSVGGLNALSRACWQYLPWEEPRPFICSQLSSSSTPCSDPGQPSTLPPLFAAVHMFAISPIIRRRHRACLALLWGGSQNKGCCCFYAVTCIFSRQPPLAGNLISSHIWQLFGWCRFNIWDILLQILLLKFTALSRATVRKNPDCHLFFCDERNSETGSGYKRRGSCPIW